MEIRSHQNLRLGKYWKLFEATLSELALSTIVPFFPVVLLSFLAEAAPLSPNPMFLQSLQIPNLSRGLCLLKIIFPSMQNKVNLHFLLRYYIGKQLILNHLSTVVMKSGENMFVKVYC